MTEIKTETEIRIKPGTVPAGQTEVSSGSICHVATKRLGLATHQVGKPLSGEGVPTNVTLCFSPNQALAHIGISLAQLSAFGERDLYSVNFAHTAPV